jgi:prevent-host-death family protein
MKISEVKSRLNSLMNDVYRDETRILVEKSGIPVAAIIPIADLRRLRRLDAMDREAREVLEAMRAPFRGVPDEEMEEQIERIMREVRAENRAVARSQQLTADSR